MKTIFAVAALALVFSSNVALAGAKTTTIALDLSCDKFDVTVSKNTAVALDAPSCAGTFGGGVVATVKGFGKAVLLALQDPSQPGVQYMLQISYPFTDGGAYTLYETTDGLRLQDAQDGTYAVENNAAGTTQSGPSITSSVRQHARAASSPQGQ